MSFSDIFKSSFLEGVTNTTLTDILLTLGLAALIGVYIAWIYKKTCTSVMYSTNFAGTLVALALITSMVILAVTSNVVLSLGMVGALSIVRFRTAIKEPLEIAYLFWAIVVGIVLAAGMIPLAIIGSVVVGIIMLIFMNRKSLHNPYIAVVRCENRESEAVAKEFINSRVQTAVIKSTTAQKGMIEMTYEILLKGNDTSFIAELAEKKGINSAVLVSYNGDYLG